MCFATCDGARAACTAVYKSVSGDTSISKLLKAVWYVSASTIAWQILSCFNITYGDYMRFNNIFWKISLGEFVCVITTGVVPFAVYVSCTEAMLGYGDFSVKSGSNFDLMD